MKIAEFVEAQKKTLPPELAAILINEHSVWSNDACYGYVIEAMENAGYKQKQITDLLHYIHSAFEFLSVEDAEKRYTEW